jgi:hypothetical protein
MPELLVLYYSVGGSLRRMSEAERTLCIAQGRRLAEIAKLLSPR